MININIARLKDVSLKVFMITLPAITVKLNAPPTLLSGFTVKAIRISEQSITTLDGPLFPQYLYQGKKQMF